MLRCNNIFPNAENISVVRPLNALFWIQTSLSWCTWFSSERIKWVTIMQKTVPAASIILECIGWRISHQSPGQHICCLLFLRQLSSMNIVNALSWIWNFLKGASSIQPSYNVNHVRFEKWTIMYWWRFLTGFMSVAPNMCDITSVAFRFNIGWLIAWYNCIESICTIKRIFLSHLMNVLLKMQAYLKRLQSRRHILLITRINTVPMQSMFSVGENLFVI